MRWCGTANMIAFSILNPPALSKVSPVKTVYSWPTVGKVNLLANVLPVYSLSANSSSAPSLFLAKLCLLYFLFYSTIIFICLTKQAITCIK